MKINLRTAVFVPTMFIIALLFSACATDSKKTRGLDTTLLAYEQVIRWSQWDGAADYLAPEYMQNNPVTRLDMDRLRLFRVTNYTIRSALPFDEGMAIRQVVEIRMFNRNRAIERTVIDTQVWRYNPDNERWFLHSGLPDVTQAR